MWLRYSYRDDTWIIENRKEFICGLFKDALNNSDYTASNDKIISELEMSRKEAIWRHSYSICPEEGVQGLIPATYYGLPQEFGKRYTKRSVAEGC
jgi:hypothetical protein